jgi:photosystem II stability/assembly factor-like uncharacterized protein
MSETLPPFSHVRILAMWLLFLSLLLRSVHSAPWWSVQTSGLDTNLRGVSVVFTGAGYKKYYAVWAAGSNGVILHSEDEGGHWKQVAVKGAENLDFRDIEAVDADSAYVMSSGDGDKSRIYKTKDGGAHWDLQYSDKRAGFFLDSVACDSGTHCVALSDPVDGKFVVMGTNDGEHWKELPRQNMPAALPKEGAFAASGTAIALCDHKIFFGTGGGAGARIFRSEDEGQTWTVSETPMVAGNPSSGIFSISCDDDDLVAVGGDYKEPNASNRAAIYSHDSGITWHLAATQPGGFRSATGACAYGDFAAVGTNGTDVSHDKGIHWQHTDSLNLNAVSFHGQEGWGVGPKGLIARFKTHWQYQIRNRVPANGPPQDREWTGTPPDPLAEPGISSLKTRPPA